MFSTSKCRIKDKEIELKICFLKSVDWVKSNKVTTVINLRHFIHWILSNTYSIILSSRLIKNICNIQCE